MAFATPLLLPFILWDEELVTVVAEGAIVIELLRDLRGLNLEMFGDGLSLAISSISPTFDGDVGSLVQGLPFYLIHIFFFAGGGGIWESGSTKTPPGSETSARQFTVIAKLSICKTAWAISGHFSRYLLRQSSRQVATTQVSCIYSGFYEKCPRNVFCPISHNPFFI